MRFSPRQLPLLLLLLALLAAGGSVLLFPDRLLESLHPWLERVASDRIDGRLTYGRLSVRGGTLVVEDLRLEKGDSLWLEVPRLEAGWTLRGVLQRRLETVRLAQPQLWLLSSAEEKAPFPPGPPLEVEAFEILDGRVAFEAAGRPLTLRVVNASGALAPRTPFRLTARVGEGEGLAVRVAGALAWGEPASLTLEEAAWDARPLLSQPLVIRLPAAGGTAEGGLQLERFDRRHLTTLLAAFRLDVPLPAGWDFTLSHPRLQFRLEQETIVLRLAVPEARVEGGGMTLPVQEVQAEIAGKSSSWRGEARFRLAGAPGRLHGHWADGSLEGEASLSVIDPAGLKRQVLGGGFPNLAGGMDIAARFQRAGDNGQARLQAELTGRPGRRPEGFLLDLAPLAARVMLEKPLGGEPSGHGSISAAGREIVRWKGTAERIEAELLASAGRELAALLPPERRPTVAAQLEDLRGKAVLAADADGAWSGSGSFRAAALPLPAGVLRQLELAAQVRAAGDGVVFRQARISGRWEGEGSATRLSAAGAGEWRQGRLRLELERFTLAEGEYVTADGLTGLTGGRLQGRGTVAGTADGPLHLDLTAEAGLREILHGPFYADLAGLPVGLALRGRLSPAGRVLEAEALRLSVQDWGTAELRGVFSPERLAVTGSAGIASLADLLQGPLGKGLQTLRPELADLRLAGAAALAGQLQRENGSWQGEGDLRLTAVSIDWPSVRLAGRGIDGGIPLRFGGGEEVRRGRLEIADLRLGPAALNARSVALAAAAGRYAIETPLVFTVAGGEMRVVEAAARLAEEKEFSARVRLQGVELEELTREMDLPVMSGQVTADLGRIRYRAGTLTADGNLGINAFGGDILVRNLRLESLFSSYRTVHGDLDFSGIDLHRLTRTFEFGEINGIADGYVHGLRLFGAVPSAFEARLETRNEGRRNISVKALNNIAVISQGGFSAALSRGIYRFIDFYRYRRIGIFCSLKNDVFVLEGTARAGSDDYLVYGGWLPPKINIVAPSRTISFKEMLKRLQRIDRTESGPAAGD